MNSEIKPRSVLVLRGRREDASYRDTGILQYNCNPVIEALPPILNEDEVLVQLSAGQPPFDPEARQAPAHLRYHMVQLSMQFFAPLDSHVELEQKFSGMLRTGYLARNPVDPKQWHELHRKVNLIGRDMSARPEFRAMTNGFFIFGISGGGKTTAVEKILNLYPQVIDHRAYRDLNFTSRQLVWLKLDCPHDGSIRGLCINFFQAVDDILGTRYYEMYATGRKTTDEMIPHMARVASLHHMGVLVIDEIQHLSGAKSGGADLMLNFFVRLINTIGLPVVLIGTYKALRLLKGEFRQARRGSGQGDVVWERMSNDRTWYYFLEALFEYQYVKKPVALTPELAGTLFNITQGITDFAVKVFMLAQILAIASKKETLTKGIFESVANDSLRLAKPVLDAMREGNLEDLSEIEDVQPIDFEKALRKQRDEQRNATRQAMTYSSSAPSLASAAPQVPIGFEDEPNSGAVAETATPDQIPVIDATKPTGKKTARPNRQRGNSVQNGGIVAVVEEGCKRKVGAHSALAQANLLAPASEYQTP